MFNEILSSEYLVDTGGTSDGTQIKYKKDDLWYKVDRYGGEANAEKIASSLLQCSSLSNMDYVIYETGKLNDKPACRSKDFLRGNDEFVTLYRVYEQNEGKDLTQVTAHMNTPEDRAEYVVDYFQKKCHIDLTPYFSKVFTLDFYMLNEDRHFNNLGLIRTENGKYLAAPIFDNGKALLVGNDSFREWDTMDNNIKRVVARPFSGSHEKNYELFSKGFNLSSDKLIDYVRILPNTREKEAFLTQYRTLEKQHAEIAPAMTNILDRESVWHAYFELPKSERNGIPWEGEKYRPAIFEDMYLAQCKKENITPDKAISEHFWQNCVKIQEYEPRFLKLQNSISKDQ